MNVTQMARNQQMMYKFINRSAGSAYQSQISSLSSFGAQAKNDGTDAASILQSMGLSGMQGRTVREMAQYQLRTQEAQNAVSARQTNTELGVGALAQRFSVRQQYTPISDEATEAMQQLALEDAKNSIGSASVDADERTDLIREHLKDVDPSKRTAAFNTMNKVWESEMDRIGSFIKEKDPGWTTWGDKFDTAILDDYKAGVNIWI